MPGTPHEIVDVVYIGKELKIVGPLAHRKRVITLDGLVRSHVYDPTMDLEVDGTLRYYVTGFLKDLALDIARQPELTGHVLTASALGLVQIRPHDCFNCGDPWYQHLNDKCLFASTIYAE